MKIVITEASIEDAEAISVIEEKSFSVPWSKQSVRDALNSDTITSYKATDDDAILCGYAMLMTAADQSELLNIAVDPDYRREGIGNFLLNKIIKTAWDKSSSAIFLEVRESNAPARRLYEKNGFTEIYRRKNYYTLPTEDAVIMVKSSEE